MFNATKQGYNAGFQDGLEGKPENAHKHMSKLKIILSATYVDTFLKGYAQGIKEGKWEHRRLERQKQWEEEREQKRMEREEQRKKKQQGDRARQRRIVNQAKRSIDKAGQQNLSLDR